jgi:hypothetical protein
LFYITGSDGKLPVTQEETTLTHSWTVETKYYSASINLRLLDYSADKEFDEKLEGIILIPHKEKVIRWFS